MESFEASVAATGASDWKPAASPPVESKNSSGLSGPSELNPVGAARTAVCSGESSVYSSSRRACAPWDCVVLLFWDMVGLTFVRGEATAVAGAGVGDSGDSAFAGAGRFGEVFSKLR